MAFKLRQNLLIDILNPIEQNKYSKSVLNIKTIFAIEEIEKFHFPDYVTKLYTEIMDKEVNFINGIHLLVIEKHFYQKKDSLNGYICIYVSEEKELQLPVRELYIMLEDYYAKMFLLASIIANLYGIEVKINDKKKDTEFA